VTIEERAQSFREAYPQWPAAWPWLVEEKGETVLYAVWVLGNDYRTRSPLYGAYPHGYLPRIQTLFPDRDETNTLHAFAGSVPPGPYARCDVQGEVELPCSVVDLPNYFPEPAFSLVLADPPYSPQDALKYHVPMIDRRLAMEALGKITIPGGFLVWLDTCWPQHRKDTWRTTGRLFIQRSTNHRIRVATIFERRAGNGSGNGNGNGA